MRLRTWLMLGYSAVLALALLGLGLGLITVIGLSVTSGLMVEDNFKAVDVASRLRRLMRRTPARYSAQGKVLTWIFHQPSAATALWHTLTDCQSDVLVKKSSASVDNASYHTSLGLSGYERR
jgi:hypothetical protein